MSTKLIFFDIDGTLMDDTGKVQESAQLALKKLQCIGHKIFIASGRCLAEIPKKILDIGFHGMVLGNGAYVEYEGQKLFHNIMDGKKVVEFGKLLEAGQSSVFFSSKVGCYVRKTVYDDFTKLAYDNPENLGFWMEFLNITKIFADINELETKNIEKINFHMYQGDIHSLIDSFSEDFSIVPSSIPNSPQGTSGEVSTVGITKATGIIHILRYIGRENEKYIAFGDNHNDIDMIKSAHIGVVMENGVDKLKKYADVITSTASNHGISKALEQLNLL